MLSGWQCLSFNPGTSSFSGGTWEMGGCEKDDSWDSLLGVPLVYKMGALLPASQVVVSIG